MFITNLNIYKYKLDFVYQPANYLLVIDAVNRLYSLKIINGNNYSNKLNRILVNFD